MKYRPFRMLDMFCGAGGAAMGYYRAGIQEIVGVDIRPQKRYPFHFVQADAIEYFEQHWQEFDCYHASPPCQHYCALKTMPNARQHPDLVPVVRDHFAAINRPWIIENVPGAPLINPIILCGSMFMLGCDDAELRRHRLFELGGFEIALVPECRHGWKPQTCGVYGHAGGMSKRAAARTITVVGGHGRDRRREGNGQQFNTHDRKQAMGIDWMTGAELSQAIPPAYTEFIGKHLIEELKRRAS